MRRVSRVLVVSCVLVGLFSATTSLDAQRRPHAVAHAPQTAIAIGDFAPIAGQRGSEGELEHAIRTALASHPAVTVSPDMQHARFVVTGSVVELSQRVLTGDEREVRCRVSVVVADARGGSVRAMLEGRAAVRGGGTEDAMRRSAVHGAVASALRSIAHVR